MIKTAVIYDKWLSAKGGGEEVAFAMLETLIKANYRTKFIYGNPIRDEELSELKVKYPETEFIRIWNDEELLKKEVSDKELFINVSFMDYSYGYARKNIYYAHFPSKIRSGLFNHVLQFFQITGVHRYLPGVIKERIADRLRAGIFPDMKKRLDSYQIFLCHSEYVRKWIKTYWKKESTVIYPPVKLLKTGINKQNWICSVGRFFTLGHGKKHEILIRAFKKLYDQGATDWELHLVGGLGSEPSSLRFMKSLKDDAKGYPIHFHVNASRNEVEEVLLQSKIYWHAAGYGEDPEKDPIKFEHFGIAPVEAISAGCVPVLYNGGGLREIVNILGLSPEKHLFDTIVELVQKTESILTEDDLKLPENVREKLGKTFSEERYHNEFMRVLAKSPYFSGRLPL